jgi:hypothetical protein
MTHLHRIRPPNKHWENVDVFNALVLAFDACSQNGAMGLLARNRCLDLIEMGKTSLVPGAP